jgi:hypothetical protein
MSVGAQFSSAVERRRSRQSGFSVRHNSERLSCRESRYDFHVSAAPYISCSSLTLYFIAVGFLSGTRQSYPGNVLMRKLVSEGRSRYETSAKGLKRSVVDDIVQTWQNSSHPCGRFVKGPTPNGEWRVLSPDETAKIVGKLLRRPREAVADVTDDAIATRVPLVSVTDEKEQIGSAQDAAGALILLKCMRCMLPPKH